MSARSSTWSESASSELDPLFLSLKEPATPRNTRHRLSHGLSPPSSLSDSPPALPATVNFPLPPRRLRPGELIGIPEPIAAAISPTHRTETLLAPVSLYGVAIGGNNPIKTNPAINGRAEVKTAGLTSLDLRKMSLRNRSSGSISHIPPLPPPPETISLRARNPSRMLAPHLPPSVHSPPARSYSHDQPALPRYQPALSRSATQLPPTHSIDRPARSPSRPAIPSSLPPRNLSLVETASSPVPRLPPTRLAYQSLSYNLTNTPEPFSTGRHPLSEAIPSDLNINPNSLLRRHPLLSSSPITQNEPDSLPLTMYSELGKITDRSNGRIKFAPLPNKPNPGGLSVSPSLNLSESQNNNPSRQSPRKKAAWIQRWLTPATKPLAAKPKPDISLPVPETLILTGTGAAKSTALVSAPTVKRRSSVNDQESPLKPAVRRERPRSRSFSAARPSLGMVASLVRTPSRSIQDTVTSGKHLLTGSQCIVSPVRAHSLHNLIGFHPVAECPPNPSSSPQPPPSSEVPAENSKITLGNTTQSELTHATDVGNLQHVPIAMSNEEEEADRSAKTKKKREIRFRNTLELIPDLVFPDSPLEETHPVESPAQARSEPFGYQASQPDIHAMDLMGADHKRRKTPMKNLGLFNHLRRPRTADTYTGDEPSGASRAHEYGRRTLQPLGSSLSHPVIQPMAALLPIKSRNNQQLAVPAEDGVSLASRKLAPKINLTFVDLDHHIGSRFSVNTLLREVHKSLPDVKPNEDSDHDSQGPSNIGQRPSQPTRLENPARQFSDPVTRQEIELQRQEPQGSGSELRSDGRDGSSSENLGSPTTATSVSNPTEVETAEPMVHHSGHDSIIEVVKTNGADVVFQMVVPVAGPVAKPTQPRQPGRRKEAASSRLEVPEMAHEEDALTVISERLVALNKSIEAHEGQRNSRAQTPDQQQQSLPVRRSPSSSRSPAPLLPAAPGVVTRRKTKRIENWLSNVPSPQTSPAPTVHEFFPQSQHSDQILHHNQLLLSTRLHQEVLDHPDLLDCPESPIDKLHRHLPSRLTMHRTSRSPTPTRA
ncbi:hypothetical protein PtB15_4B867 [Puccinia triticina]|nr:hypothetical protein PtB15_4B867 [Puccinia triticina]